MHVSSVLPHACMKMMLKRWVACIELDRYCADICRLAVAFMARADQHTDRFAHQLCALCSEICEACAEECRQHDIEHCQNCADACEAFAKACQEMVKDGSAV